MALYSVACGQAIDLRRLPASMRGAIAGLAMDLIRRLTASAPNAGQAFEVPSDLHGPPLGAWIIAREIERTRFCAARDGPAVT